MAGLDPQTPTARPESETSAARDSGEVRFSGRMTGEDVRAILKLSQHWSKRTVRVVAWTLLGLITLDCLAIAIVGLITREPAAAGLAAAGAFVCLVIVAAKLLRMREAHTMLRTLELEQAGPFRPFQGTAADSGLTYRSDACELAFRWSAFTGYRASNRVAILYNELLQPTLYLTRRAFSRDDDWYRCLGMVRQHLRSR